MTKNSDSKQSQLEFSGDTSLSILEESITSISGTVFMKWPMLSKLLDRYMKSNRGRRLHVEHFKEVAISEVRRILLDKAQSLGKPVLNIHINISSDFNLLSKELKANIELDWFPKLPEINLTECTIKQFSIEPLVGEDFKKFQDKFLDSHKVHTDYDGMIDNGDLVDLIPLIEEEGSDEDILQEDSKITIRVGVDPFDPDLISKILGSKVGDMITHTITMPSKLDESVIRPEFRAYKKDIMRFVGKDVDFKLQIHRVQRSARPVLDEDFLKKFNLDSEEQLNTKIQENVSQYIETSNTKYCVTQVLDFLRSYDFDIPESHTMHYVNTIFLQFTRAFNLSLEVMDPSNSSNNSNSNSGYDNLGDNLSDKFKSDFMTSVVRNMPSYKETTFNEFLSKMKQVGKKIACGDFLIEKLPPMIDLDEELITKVIVKLLSQVNLKGYDRSQVDQYIQDSRNNIILSKTADYLKKSGNVISESIATPDDLEDELNKLTENTLYKRYFELL